MIPPNRGWGHTFEIGLVHRFRRTDSEKPERGTGVDESRSKPCSIEKRSTHGELVVVADVPGASVDNLSVGITTGTDELVIRRNGTDVGRVALPWPSPEVTRCRFKNGVLEVRMESETTGSGS